MGGGEVVAELAQHPQQRRRAQHLGDGVPLADLVEPRRGRGVQRALEARDGHPAGQPADDGLDGEGQPAHVGGHPVDVAVFVARLPVGVGPRAEEEPADAVHHTLRPRLGARGEDQERRLVGVERHGRRARGARLPARRRTLCSPSTQRHGVAGAVDHHGRLNARGPAARGPQRLQQRHGLGAAVDRVRHDDDLRPRRLQPRRHRLLAEAGEEHGVDRADPVAGVDGGEGLDQVGHVDRDDVTLGHAQLQQPGGQPAHLVGQLGVGQRAGVAGFALPHHRGPVRRRRVLGPAVDAVVGDVDLPALEVAEVVDLAGADRRPRREPALLLRHPLPVGVRPVQRAGRGELRDPLGNGPLRTQRDDRRVQQLRAGCQGVLGHRRPPHTGLIGMVAAAGGPRPAVGVGHPRGELGPQAAGLDDRVDDEVGRPCAEG